MEEQYVEWQQVDLQSDRGYFVLRELPRQQKYIEKL